MSEPIVRYIAEEVARQQDGPLMVASMYSAWLTAMRETGLPTVEQIEHWGRLVCPLKNAEGFRSCRVRVGIRLCPEPMEVRPRMERLVGYLETMDPALAYYEFQMIHPFRDGNGRTGKILFNYLKGTLADPEMPPNFFDCANP